MNTKPSPQLITELSSPSVYATADVYILDNPFAIDRPYAYYIPTDITEEVTEGRFVTVPFGRSNRKQIGLVVAVRTPLYEGTPEELAAAAGSLHETKPITAVCTERLTLSDEQLALCRYLKEQTLCTMGEAVRTVVPSGAMVKLTEMYIPQADSSEALPANLHEDERAVMEALILSKKLPFHSLRHRFGSQIRSVLSKLTARGLLRTEMQLKQPTLPSEKRYILTIPPEDAQKLLDKIPTAKPKLQSEKQKAVVRALLSCNQPMSQRELCEASGAGKTQFDALVAKEILKEETVVSLPFSLGIPADIQPTARTPHALNEEQSKAFETLCALADTGEPKAALLYGVTGSGKTCVMLEMIDRMLEKDKGVIVLLPEISLTPQMLSIFHARYGTQVAVIHSGLSGGERQSSYLRILCGDARVVVGTRSAVFAPVRNLGMIIMDEEQEHTYKSDMNPKYHARDIARYRCAVSSALLLLASATPSLESYHKAMEGKYTLITMKQRYGKGGLPRVEIVDMRGEAMLGNTTPLSQRLSEMLTENHAEGNQSVLFLNRRGYSTRLVCRSCGKAVTCPHCSVAMNYHIRGNDYSDGELVCHWCGTRRRSVSVCPECGSPHLTRMGYGTQRLEQELSSLLPDAKIMRMDADTTASKTAYHDLLGSFRNREADILMGTQMVTKGHDFPDVTLVGVLLADASLYLDDYRAAERTFSMLTQVIGRAGRGDRPGLAVIQTMNPDHEIIRGACRQEYEAFYEQEIKLRRLLVFPPFCDITLLTLTSPDEKELQKASLRLSEELTALTSGEYSDVPVVSFGPFEAPVYRVENIYRMRMVIKCRLNKRSRQMFAELLSKFSSARKNAGQPMLSVDFNPSGI